MFEQSKFKKDFVLMNQKARQRATSSVEKDCYKLLNNSNFGIDCRNNIGNCFLEPLHGDFSEISYVKRFTRILNDDAFRNFFPISFEGRNNSDISIENILIEQRRAHARG